MKVNPVKQFVKNNISRFEKSKGSSYLSRIFNLYDHNNSYRGEYQYVVQRSYGCKPTNSLSSVRIISDKLKQEMAEYVYIDKELIDLYEPESKEFIKIKRFPKEITTTTTILDFVNDRFQTIRSVSKLKNKLKRIGKDNPDLIYRDDYIVYEPLTEKPQFEKCVEVIREGSISETEKNTLSINRGFANYRGKRGCSNQIPYKFW